MKTARLKRKLLAWERYERRLEKLSQTRIYNAHIHYIAVDTMRHLYSRTTEVGSPLDSIVWNWDEVGT